MTCKRIESLKDLQKRASKDGGCECFISFGIARSSKHIWYYPEENNYSVYNEIDGSDLEEIYFETLERETNIIEALNAGALYAY